MSRGTPIAVGIGLGMATFVLYQLVGYEQRGTDSHWPLAQAFVDGRLVIADDRPWLELVPRSEGRWYSPFPPLLSIVLVPFAALQHHIDTGTLAAVLGGLSVALMWLLLGRLGLEFRARLGLTVAWAVGSQLLWVAGSGGQHLAPQVAAAVLLQAALLLGLMRRAPLFAGLLLGVAAAARLPVALAIPLILVMHCGRHPHRALVARGGPSALSSPLSCCRSGASPGTTQCGSAAWPSPATASSAT